MEKYRSLNTRYETKRFALLKDWENYAAYLRQAIKVSLALTPEPPRPPLQPQIFGRWNGDGYSCEKVYFESLPGFYVTGNLFRPAASLSRMPVILCPHGHWEDGRLHDRDPLGSVIARCITLARMGALVFSPDMVGYNDSCQLPHWGFPVDPAFGLSLMAVQTWNNIRSLDFLLALSGADPDRVGVTGESGGGTQTFILNAIDDRVKVAAPIVMVSRSMQGGCLCENAPLLRLFADNVDIARLFAPKPLFLGSCTGDWTSETPTVEFPAVREVYALYGAAEKVMNFHVDSAHNYNLPMREHVYGFFNKFLFGGTEATPIPEATVMRPPHRDRMVFWGRTAPSPITPEEFTVQWRQRTENLLQPYLASPEQLRRQLVPLLPYVLGGLPPNGATATGDEPQHTRIERTGETLTVAVSARQTDPAAEKITFFDTYNATTLAVCVREISAAVTATGENVKLQGLAGAGPACLAAAAINPRVTAVEADMAGFDPTREEDWKRFLDTPGLRRIGGIATLLAALGSRPVTLRHAAASLQSIAAEYGSSCSIL